VFVRAQPVSLIQLRRFQMHRLIIGLAPTNAVIISGQGTNAVVVDYSASFVSGTLRVASLSMHVAQAMNV
jgi:hypothetical protein